MTPLRKKMIRSMELNNDVWNQSARTRGRKGGRPPVSQETKGMAKQICDRLSIAKSTLYK